MDATSFAKDIKSQLTASWDMLMEWSTQPETLQQLMFVAFALVFSFLVAHVLRTYITAVKEPDGRVDEFSKRWFMRRSGRLIFPFIATIALLIMHVLAQSSIGKVELIEIVQRVVIIAFLWIAFKAYITNTLIRVIGLWIVIPSVTLALFGWFNPTVDYLNQFGFNIGDVEITAYTVIKAIFFISLVGWLGKILDNSTELYIRQRTNLPRATKELLIKIFDIVLYTTLFLITLKLIGIDLTALAVFGGALGVGLGFGLQKIASNFISGIILLSERSININNLIEMDDGIYGYVRKLGARASIVETFDGKEVMVPNEDFITSRVSNLTHSSTNGRIEIPVGVSYNSDMHKVREILLQAVHEYDSAIHDHENDMYNPKCFMREYGDSSVNFLVTFWLEDVTTGRWRAQSEVMFNIWDLLAENGIEIPFPQRDLHIRSGLESLEEPEKEPKKASSKKAASKKSSSKK